jgi:hypothetical protein
MDRDWTASFSIRFRNGTCIIILDKKYNIENSSCHFGSYGSIWTNVTFTWVAVVQNVLFLTITGNKFVIYVPIRRYGDFNTLK